MRLEELRLVKKLISLFLVFTILLSCQNASKKSLPFYGNRDLSENGDTIYHQIPEFSFINQFGDQVSDQKFKGKIYIADFFFTTCPGICPVMTKQLKRVQKEISDKEILFLSHTVDPDIDSVNILLKYGKEKGADFSTWDFVTGSKKKLYKMAEHYLVVGNEDPNTEIKFVHSEMFVLIDKNSRIRGMYDGTDSVAVNQLIQDVKLLKQEPWK